ncbi:MAG: hypothetical protein JWQ42_3202 [Edaphobacter sp.]|nr:hypothetical protein [Edaphobacter sp.]
MFTPEFYLLAQECDLAKASLLGALTAFSYMDVGQTGTMYSAFFQAAIGLERLMKLVVIVDHNVKHDLSNPTDKQLRKAGHDLVGLYETCSTLAVDNSLDTSEWFSGDVLERRMLDFLSKFAMASRYYNLDTISGSSKAADPIAVWAQLHQLIGEAYISFKSREKLNEKAIQHADALGAYGFRRWIDGQYITFVDATYMHAFLTKANPYCVWTLLRILKPFYSLLDALCSQAHAIEIGKGIDYPIIPYATEFFPFFLATLDSVKKRKDWTKIFLR